MGLQSQLVQVATLLQQGQLSAAEASCRTLLAAAPELPAALHLLGLIREQSGDVPAGEQLLRQSINRDPRNADFHVNLAHLLRRHGKAQQAEAVFRQAVQLAPGSLAARHGLALTLTDLGRFADAAPICSALLVEEPAAATLWMLLGYIRHCQDQLPEAETAYRKVLALEPANAAACHNLGAVLARMDRAEEALSMLERAQELGAAGADLKLNLARSYALLNRIGDAERCYVEALASNPVQVEAQVNLARLRFMRGDADYCREFAAACVAHPEQPAMQLSLAVVLRCAGQLNMAEQHLREMIARLGPLPELRSELAQVLLEAERLPEAEAEALEAATGKPGESIIVENLVSILLARGRPEEALPFIKVQRERQPLLQNWIAHEAVAARLLRRGEYRVLYDYDRFIRTYDLEPPPGWSTMAQFHADLLAVLRQRHQDLAHPFDQSLRNGSQTARNLVTESEPVIKALLAAFEAPLRAYVAELGTDPAHPLLARNTGQAAIAGAWSVQLRREGFHVNHLHPEGWISSAYYVDVPEEVQDQNLKSGWLKFGEPRFPVPEVTAERFVQPRAGRLVLFPSYFWHGTNPIHGEQARVSVAFDAVPVAVGQGDLSQSRTELH